MKYFILNLIKLFSIISFEYRYKPAELSHIYCFRCDKQIYNKHVIQSIPTDTDYSEFCQELRLDRCANPLWTEAILAAKLHMRPSRVHRLDDTYTIVIFNIRFFGENFGLPSSAPAVNKWIRAWANWQASYSGY